MPKPSVPIAGPASSGERAPRRRGAIVDGYRWFICGLLFFAATINYVDRQVIGILKPTLQAEFGWTEIDYADIVFAFQLAYAIGLLFAGRLMDRFGARIGFAFVDRHLEPGGDGARRGPLFGPGVAAMLAMVAGLAYAPSVAGFIAARFALGSARRAIFRRRSRSWPSGSRSASARSRPASSTPAPTSARSSRRSSCPSSPCTWGWYWAFIATGALGFLLAGGWWI